MMIRNKLILLILLFVALISFSCKQDTNYFSIPKSIIGYQIKINNTPVDTTFKNGIKYNDTTYLNLIFKENLNVSEVLLSVPSRVICDIYFNGKYFASNKHESIYNVEYLFLNPHNGIPISPENTDVKLLFKGQDLIKAGDLFSFVIKKSPIYMDKIKAIEFYSKKAEYSNFKPKRLSILTENFLTESNLPIVKINTSASISDKWNSFGEFEVYAGESTNSIEDKPIKKSNLEIKIRGQSSQYYRKQSYKITSLKADSTKNNIKLLGLPKENDWIFYAPYWDESLMRNNLVYQLWGEMGYYSPRTKYVELVINNDYRGVYVLTEKIKIDKNRMNLNKLSKKDTSLIDISGGYIFKLDKGKEICWPSNYAENGYSRCYYYASPKYKNLNKPQRKYIKNYVNNFEEALYKDTNWLDYINEESFIDFIILTELAKNIDSYRLSTYMSKDKGGKLKMGPIWDFDRAFGNDDKEGANRFDGFIYDLKFVPFWWSKLMSNEDFKLKLIKRYKELRATIISDENIKKIILDNYNTINPSMEREALRWRTYQNIEGNPLNAKSFNDAVDYLRYWTLKRAKHLDKVWN